MEFNSLLNLAQTFVLVATVGVMVWEVRHAHRVSQMDRYRAVNDYYIEFLKLCLEHPDIDMDDLDELEGIEKMDSSQRRKLLTAELLICIWEHAYDSYRAGFLPQSQWDAWEKWIEHYLKTKLTREQWAYLIEDYGPEIVLYLRGVLARARPLTPLAEADLVSP